MSGGGLMQLVAYGAQDMYLTGNPGINFFRTNYRRHTNFAMEEVENTHYETPSNLFDDSYKEIEIKRLLQKTMMTPLFMIANKTYNEDHKGNDYYDDNGDLVNDSINILKKNFIY